MKARFLLLAPCLLLLLSPTLRAHEAATEMADAATVWLTSLTDQQKARAVYPIESDEHEIWYFVPKPFEGEGMRKGLPLKDMRPEQRHLAYALLSSALSHHGFATAMEIMSLEQVLWELENENPRRDTLMYYLTLFGQPGGKAWGWRFEGHHLALNFTVSEGKLVSNAPNFFGSNPAELREGPRAGLRVLAREEDVARDLVKSLAPEQSEKAILADKTPKDILTKAETTVTPLEARGIAYRDLQPEQQTKLRDLIGVYLHRARAEVADQKWQKIEKAGLDGIVFTWIGGTEKGEAHYYRVQGPNFLLEYANTQNNANHVHSVWRDFQGDFGRDLLREHYQAYHQAELKGLTK